MLSATTIMPLEPPHSRTGIGQGSALPRWKRVVERMEKTRAGAWLERQLLLSGPWRGAPLLQRRWEHLLNGRFHRDPELAVAAYRWFNAATLDLADNEAPALIRRGTELGYVGWPRQIRHLVVGRDVLDIGCDNGGHGIGFVVVGAKSYTGVDPRIDPRRDLGRDLRTGRRTQFGWTGAQMMQQMPRIRLVSGGVEALPPDQRFDVAVLHNVTEHLLALEDVLAATASHLRIGGELVFNHHNFYCWNGHHKPPKRVVDIDDNDPEQLKYLDWAHLDFDPPEGHAFLRRLNRLRLHEVREITERHYDILEWTPITSSPAQGLGRLTPAIVARHPELAEQEFTTQHVFCRATPKRSPLTANGP